MISGLIRVKLEETGSSKIITHMVGLKELFPEIDIENCKYFMEFLVNHFKLMLPPFALLVIVFS